MSLIIDGLLIVAIIGLTVVYRRLERRIEAVDESAARAFEFIGGDVGELYARVGDLEEGRGPPISYSAEAANGDVFTGMEGGPHVG